MKSAIKTLVVDARMLNASGIGTDLQNLLPQLKVNFNLILLGSPQEIKQFDWAQGVDVIKFTSPIYSASEQILLPLLVPNCDIFLSPHFNVPLLPLRAKSRSVIIHDVYHLASSSIHFVHKLYARILLKAAVSLSKHIITISDFSISEIKKYLNTGDTPIHKLTLGVDHELFRVPSVCIDTIALVKTKYNLPSKFILYVGNIKPHKNLLSLVKAFQLLQGNDEAEQLKLVIVGKKDGFLNGDSQLFNFIEEKKLSDKILFTGYVESVHLPIIYNVASAFVFPSLYEGFGLPPLEAMASGCPTIVSNAASMPEVCKNASYYINASNPNDIALAIKEVLQNKDLRDSLIIKGLNLVQQYKWYNASDKLCTILAS